MDPKPEVDLREEVRLAKLREIAGLTIDDCLKLFQSENDPYVAFARSDCNSDEGYGCSDRAVVVPDEGGVGSHVLLWRFVSNSDAGIDHLNFYRHEDCEVQPGVEWEDTYDCAVDTECPACGHDISPYHSQLNL